jgi:acetylornithine deacetylase/succinyl-diaminopimelate desuccinylase-like protein
VLARVARVPAVVVTDLVTSGAGRTVVSAWARARLNVRLAGGQRPDAVVRALRRHLAGRVPAGVRGHLSVLAACPPYRQPAGDPGGVVAAARRACRVGFGVEPVLAPSGGSIPFVNVLAERTGMPVLLLGFGLPGDRAHAPNERLYLPNLDRGTATCVELYAQLARVPLRPGR